MKPLHPLFFPQHPQVLAGDPAALLVTTSLGAQHDGLCSHAATALVGTGM